MFPSPATVRWSSSAPLIGARRPASRFASHAAVKRGPSGSDAEPDAQVRIELARLEQPPRAEAAHVAVGEPAAVVERDRGPRVRVVGRAVA